MRHYYNMDDSDRTALEMVRYRVCKIRKFYTHLFIFTVGVLLYAAKTYYGAPFNFWPITHINSFFMAIWTFIISIQGVKLFFMEKVFGTGWEQKKIQEILNKDKQNK